ncbi:hypothetical protein NEUTE1DRAFT_100982 [Neurospora tetrasperma FGSC 2508]|uniref:Uncharacterized protein n=1 Tax=Neurospora tetrasperma (strain FGSC 2508 / ATCC MYA-4615 / P0657) TaxID=510951 RepID=F8MJS2_NEUT8|nr:uncharacterized protein NEUTE1DRAFT_100982 [Neurospora tetrasperma FGSC 2508]EGO58109.1 hypothetical protein NEUTE1DRAFT_100982 [Neurospora tetrasperma FGSC 2508]EGZ71582.1 hypothetical protein NEUTE2DRAFT_63726 [Neurospora tetrasperma FGSC 2509]
MSVIYRFARPGIYLHNQEDATTKHPVTLLDMLSSFQDTASSICSPLSGFRLEFSPAQAEINPHPFL